jgi:hypothetical protein
MCAITPGGNLSLGTLVSMSGNDVDELDDIFAILLIVTFLMFLRSMKT